VLSSRSCCLLSPVIGLDGICVCFREFSGQDEGICVCYSWLQLSWVCAMGRMSFCSVFFVLCAPLNRSHERIITAKYVPICARRCVLFIAHMWRSAG
jgi:hypothetical protein